MVQRPPVDIILLSLLIQRLLVLIRAMRIQMRPAKGVVTYTRTIAAHREDLYAIVILLK